jgi:hypothetical protein
MVYIDVIGDNISVSMGEETVSLKYSKEAYEKLSKRADKANSAETVEEYKKQVAKLLKKATEYQLSVDQYITTACDWVMYDQHQGKYYLAVDGEPVTTLAMPQSLVDRIIESVDKGIDFMPVVKLWTRFLRNPWLETKGEEFAERFADFVNMTYVRPDVVKDLTEVKGYSEEVAKKLATVYQIKITKEGLLNGYKVSKEIFHKFDAETGEMINRYKRTFNVNTGEIESEGLPEFVEDRIFEPAVMGTSGDAFYCGEELGHFIKVGKTHALQSWDQVNTNDSITCVPGLHVGGLYYINWYSGEIHNIFVDPMHIGAIPDSNDGAIRCKQYFVHSSLEGVNGSMYHSSEYAALTDEEWLQMRKDIQSNMIMTFNEVSDNLTKEVLNLQSIS